VASLIVGFVTASIRSWVDRVFLVILLTSLVGLPITHSIMINLIVVALAALLMVLRQSEVIKSVREDWALIILPAVLGGILGRLLGLQTKTTLLLALLGGYAILTGLRMIFIKPLPERDDKLHPNWQVPIAFFFGGLTGMISAGGKPFSVPIYNWIMGHHPNRAYALSSVGVTVAAWSALGAQVATGNPFSPIDLGLAVFAFILITVTALGIERIWTPKLNQIVTWIVAPTLVLVGIRFIWMARLFG
ncbi:MAG: TSUP family transporter, partial [Candidatus Kryptoniota bacterium]